MSANSTRGPHLVAIFGAGEAGRLLAHEIMNNGKDRRLVAFFDDAAPVGSEVYPGIKVLGSRKDLGYWIETLHLDEIYLAIPSLPPSQQASIAREIHQYDVNVQTLPAVEELLIGKPLKKQLSDDLLSALIGREIRDIDLPRIADFVSGKVILVTGAGGSIGSELVRQLSRFGPRHLILLDQYDTHLHEIQIWLEDHGIREFTTVLGNVREPGNFRHLFEEREIDLVIHAAAVKHVPMAECNIRETLMTNVQGTLNLLELACEHMVPHFMLISTDKAVRPTNVMGATKRVCELICQNVSAFPFFRGRTRVSAVRFGNVLGSNGSVLPRFISQIDAGGPVTVTHPDIERFFMHTSEAAQLVLQSASLARGGEIFILDMGQPVRLADFARRLISSFNLKVDEDVAIEFTGLRPGEKIKEELIIEDAEEQSCYESIYVISSRDMSIKAVKELIDELESVGKWGSEDDAYLWLRERVPEFQGRREEMPQPPREAPKVKASARL
jgi:FlaA1/EpsC-like NDP-sugar epimerase